MAIILFLLTEYFALVASSSPSLSQLIIGFGFPWAEQLSRVLPPSFASTYCGGVAVNEGGAVEEVKHTLLKSQRINKTALKYLSVSDSTPIPNLTYFPMGGDAGRSTTVS